jgi:hypothetical protein
MRATLCHNNRDQTQSKNETTPTFVTTTPAKRTPSHDLEPLPPIIRKSSDDNTTDNSNANDDSVNEVLLASQRPCSPELMGVFGTRFANPTETAFNSFRSASATNENKWIPMGIATSDSKTLHLRFARCNSKPRGVTSEATKVQSKPMSCLLSLSALFSLSNRLHRDKRLHCTMHYPMPAVQLRCLHGLCKPCSFSKTSSKTPFAACARGQPINFARIPYVNLGASELASETTTQHIMLFRSGLKTSLGENSTSCSEPRADCKAMPASPCKQTYSLCNSAKASARSFHNLEELLALKVSSFQARTNTQTAPCR